MNRYRILTEDPFGTCMAYTKDETGCMSFTYDTPQAFYFDSLQDARLFAKEQLEHPRRCWIDDGKDWVCSIAHRKFQFK